MRIVMGLFFVLLGIGRAHADAPETPPVILSYGEIMQLTPDARVAYLRDLGELLALMEEKFEGRYEVAAGDDQRRLRDQVASLIRMTRLLPEASAESARAPFAYANVKPQWNGTDYTCGDGRNVKFVPRLVTCVAVPSGFTSDDADPTAYAWRECPTGTHAVELRTFKGWVRMGAFNCIPDASWSLLNDNVKKHLGGGGSFNDYAKMTPGQKAAHVGVANPLEPAGVPAVANPNGQAPKPGSENDPVNCQTPTGEAYKKLVQDFRKSDAKYCIAGGFFTKKKEGAITKASCEKKRKFPDQPVDKMQLRCTKPNQVMCNPSIFCLQIRGVSYTSKANGAAKTDLLQSLCVKDTPFLTRDCNEAYKARVGQAPREIMKGYEDAKSKKVESCDPATLDIPFLKGKFMDEYRNLQTETENMFAAHCTGNDKQFLPLFCEECRIVGERLKKMPTPGPRDHASGEQHHRPGGNGSAGAGR